MKSNNNLGKHCAQIIQLNNAVDYATKFNSLLVTWNVGFTYLLLEEPMPVQICLRTLQSNNQII